MNRRIAFAFGAWMAGSAGLFAQDNLPSVIGSDQIVLTSSTPVESNPAVAATTAPGGCATGCGNAFADSATACSTGRAGRFFGSLDFLLFNFRDGPAPALIQHVPTAKFPADGQALDPNAAQTMYGNGIRQHAFTGVNFMFGSYINDNCGWEVSYTEFEAKSKDFFIASPGDPSIGRYYNDLTNSNQPITYLIYSNPNGSVSGFINVQAPTRLWMFDANVRISGNAVFGDHFDWLVGFRYLDLREGLFINDLYQDNANGVSYVGEDRFYTSNQFYGAQFGGRSRTDLGCGFCLDTSFKLAFGGVRQVAQISGATTELRNGVVVNRVIGDVLTQPTNVGEYERGFFAVVPELAIKVGYQVTSRLSLNVGYNLIAISNVVRPGTIIDEGINPNVNPYLIPNSDNTSQRPGFSFNGTDFWAQGLTLGVALNY